MNKEKFANLLAERRTLTMGVLNVTPDSFSDGGIFLETEAATRRAAEMLYEGADILDIGGQSTRPPGQTYGEGAAEVSVDEELQRVIPVVKSISLEYPDSIISIDTTKSEVARQALESGATIINDVSGGTEDEAMLDVAGRLHAPIILMHGYGPEFRRTRIEDYFYEDVLQEVLAWLSERIALAIEKGADLILADIGFGFAKGAEDNIRLLKEHRAFASLKVPLVVGVSRKSTIGKILGGLPPHERLSGSLAAAIYAAQNGAKIIRTHDIRQTVEAFKVIDRLVT